MIRVIVLFVRHHSWPVLWARLLKAALRPVYECTDRYILRLSPGSAVSDAPGEEVTEITRDHLNQMLEVMYVSRRGLLKRFDQRERCFGVLDQGRILSYFWSQVGTKDLCELRLRFNLRPNQAWMYNGVTCKEARGRGLYPRVTRHIMATLGQVGIDEYYIDVDPRNEASIRGLNKVGFRRIALIQMRKALWRIRYSVRVYDQEEWPRVADLIENLGEGQWK